MAEGRNRRRWAGWVSALVSGAAIAFPYLFPSIFPDGALVYYVITIPLGVVAGVFAHVARSGWLMVLAVVAGLSPLLSIGVILVVMQLLYVVTGGRLPGPEWL